MKPLLFIPAILLLILSSCGPSSSSSATESDTAFYFMNPPHKGSHAPDFTPRIIKRDSTRSIHILRFDPSSTGNTYAIHTQDGNQTPLLSQHFEPEQKQEMDISSLRPGKYWMGATAIAESVTFEIEIQ